MSVDSEKELSMDDFSWDDVTPIPQDDGPNPAVPIAYTLEFKNTMDLFRAMVARDERDHRALAVTTAAIKLNAANYTVWHFRRVLLESLNGNLEKENNYLNEMGMQNPKNYQLWYHRKWLAAKLEPDSGESELNFTAQVLSMDAKNYHAWSHRQWVLKELGGIDAELEFCHSLITCDVRNNSAWNQRYWVILNNTKLGGIINMRSNEIKYCYDAISRDYENESPWLYLRGLFKSNDNQNQDQNQEEKNDFIENEELSQLCRSVISANDGCFHVMSFMLDRLCEGYLPQDDDYNAFCMEENSSDGGKEMAIVLCDRLIVLDCMHSNYWKFRQEMLLND